MLVKYISSSTRLGQASEAERKKKAKYAHLESSHYFVPVAVETLGVLGSEARTLLRDLGRRLKDSTLEPRCHSVQSLPRKCPPGHYSPVNNVPRTLFTSE